MLSTLISNETSNSTLLQDVLSYLLTALYNLYQFILPKWNVTNQPYLSPQEHLTELWQHTLAQAAYYNATMAEFLLRHFDTNGDGHISAAELLNTTEVTLKQQFQAPNISLQLPQQFYQYYYPPHPQTFWQWFAREWPLMDWKIGVFVWRTFGGMLFVLALLSIIPGRLHGISARILRWPVLGLTYFLVVVELMVYLVIRIFIRIAEDAIARPKHRKLRRKMALAKSYQEWYGYAKELDQSQKRQAWLADVTGDDMYGDDTLPMPPPSSMSSGYYNWGFIRELIHDMRKAREKGDSLLALAVIQQCTRHNVGGILSEELYSYSNSGEPKAIVTDFIAEVETTLHWITDEAVRLTTKSAEGDDCDEGERQESASQAANEIVQYEARLQRKLRVENDKVWRGLIAAAMQFLDHGGKKTDETLAPLSSVGGSRSTADNATTTTLSSECASNDSSCHGHHDHNGQSQKSPRPCVPRPMSQPQQLPSFHRERVLNFLKRARTAYGRTALCLSGGAMMGLYHFGVVKALLESKLLPHIISGTSAGSVVGAILCTRTEDELLADLDPKVLVQHLVCFRRPWRERLKGLYQTGNLFDFKEWMDLIKWFSRGDTTFLEAYRRTGRIFCITLSSTSRKSPPVLLNYLSAPDVTIASAVIASAAVPGFIPPVRLQVKDSNGVVRNQGGVNNQTFWDGSIQQDLPTQGLAEMLNCQFFIASQCNPHIVPFFFNPKGGVGRPSRWSSGHQEDSWRGGFLLAALEMYLKNDMKAKFRFLHDVEASIGFTSTMLTQEFVGSTTIVPQIKFKQFFGLISDPTIEQIEEYMQGGQVAAYEHIAMIKLNHRIARALGECVAKLESSMRQTRVKQQRSGASSPGRCHETGVGLSPDTFDAVVVKLRQKLQQQYSLTDPYVDSPLDSDDDDEDDYEHLYGEEGPSYSA